MKQAVVVGLGWILAGCAMSVQEAPSFHQEPLDISQWMESPEAHKGYIFLCDDLDRGVATDLAGKIVGLDQAEGVERITVLINSYGGEASAWRMIHNAIRLTSKPVDVVNIGDCYSAACTVFASATGRKYAYENAHFMVHKPELIYPSKGEYKEIVDFETEIYQLALRKTLPADWFPLTQKGRYFTAQQALQYGFIDQIVNQWPP